MVQTVIIRRQDGGVSVMWLDEGLSPAEHVAKWEQSQSVPAVAYRVVDSSTLPSDRWMDSWVDDGVKVTVDLTKARAQKKKELLIKRNAQMLVLTAAIEAADDNGDTQTLLQLKAKRIKLRNADTDLDTPLASAASLAAIDSVTLVGISNTIFSQ